MSEETFAEQMARIDALFGVTTKQMSEFGRVASACADTMRRLDPVCDYSYLRESQCAHCLGHKLDPELEAVVEA